MQGWAARYGRFSVLILINILGVIWIHHDLSRRGQPKLRVLNALPARDVDRTDRFSLIFDEPLPLSGSPGRAVAESLFVVEPRLAGQWLWAAPERLEYKLDEPLPAGRRFTIKPSPQLEHITGRTLAGATEFRFQTRPLKLDSCALIGSDREYTHVELRFNQKVSPADLLRHVRITDGTGSDRLHPQSVNKDPSDTLVLRVPRGRADSFRVAIDKSLTGVGAELGLQEEASHQLQLQTLFTVLRADLESPRLDKDVAVRLDFSKAIDRTQQMPPVQVTPPVASVRVRPSHDSGLWLEGPFECGRRYTVTVGSDLVSQDKQPLGDNGTISFEVPDRRPTVYFPVRSGLLTPGGNLAVDLKAVNIGGLHIKTSRVHPNNLVFHLHGHERNEVARELPPKTVPLDLPRNKPTTLALDLHGLVGNTAGIYRIEAEATDQAWTDDSVVVAVTDLIITAKQHRDGVVAWVTSLNTGSPVVGAEVVAVSFNGQALGKAVTGTDGLAHISVPATHPDGKPWLVTAQLGDDLTFLQPNERPWVVDGVDESGRDVPTTYDVMLYTERGAYRPGDTIHLSGVVRDALGQVPPPFPLAITVQRPDGREVARLPVKPEPGLHGMFSVDYATSDDGHLGPYCFTATLPGAKEALGETHAFVEEFLPVRLEVRAEPVQTRFGRDEDVNVRVSARYLFDQPCAGLALTASGSYRRTSFISKKHPAYSFHDPDEGINAPMAEAEASLDERGEAIVGLDAPPSGAPALWDGEVAITVTEAGGRSVSRKTRCLVDIASRHVGLRMPAGKVVEVETAVPIEWIQVNGDDDAAEPGPMSYALCRVDRDWTIEEVDGRMAWKTTEQVIQVVAGETNSEPQSADQGRLEIICPSPGLYRLRVTDCFSGVVTDAEFTATDGESGDLAAATNRPEQLEIVLDGEKYMPGSTAKVVVKSPFSGTMLLTLETDRVIDQRVLELSGRSIELDLPVPPTVRGGAFVSATVVRAVDSTRRDWLPHRAMGMARLTTDHSGNELPVTIETQAKAQPGQTVTVRVQAPSPVDPRSPSVVHLWAVDEGILLTTAYKTPSPLQYFFAPRQAAVTSADAFGDLLPDYERPAGTTRIGADAEPLNHSLEEAARRSPVSSRRYEPAVVWRAVMPLDATGAGTAQLQMPEVTGEMRIMAVVVDGDRYGSAQKAMTLTAPLLVEMSWPRFAAPGDRFDVPVKLFNATTEPLLVKLSLQSDGLLEVNTRGAEDGVLVTAGEPATTWIRASTTGIGPAHVTARATATLASGEPLTAHAEADLPVRPAGPLHAETRFVRVPAGQPYELPSLTMFLPQTQRISLSISPRPTVQLEPAVDALIDYPYGCVEQTTSRLIVLLAAPDLLKLTVGNEGRIRQIGSMIEAGIVRLWSMQTRSGGLSYWPGGHESDPWGTTYAAGFLADARRGGYAVSADFSNELTKYLRAQLSDSQEEETDDNLRAEICRAIGAMTSPEQGWLARLSDQIDKLDTGGRAALAGAWLDAGRKDRALSVLPADTMTATTTTTTSGRLTSQVRAQAMLLSVLLNLDENHPWIPELVARLEKMRRDNRWGSTLDNATALAALVRYESRHTQSPSWQGTLRRGTEGHLFDHADKQTFTFSGAGEPIRMESSGEGDIYVSATTEGLLRQNAPTEYDHGLVVSRRWTDRHGKDIDRTKLRIGDLILVETSLAAPGSAESVDNVAIVDALPAGMEVENPRLSTSENTGEQSAEADRVEFRDDRVVIFASAQHEKKAFRYALRVVSSGAFELPPIQASCMYDAGLASIHAGGRVEIAR